jgi:hypothetical protein
MTVHREGEERTDFIQADSRRLAYTAHSSGREKAESMGNSTLSFPAENAEKAGKAWKKGRGRGERERGLKKRR